MSYFSGIQFYFTVTNIYATIMRVINGVITWELIIYAAVGFIGCMVGDMIGKIVFGMLDAKKLKK